MTFHTKFQRVHNLCILGVIREMDLLKPIMELDVYYYLISTSNHMVLSAVNDEFDKW